MQDSNCLLTVEQEFYLKYLEQVVKDLPRDLLEEQLIMLCRQMYARDSAFKEMLAAQWGILEELIDDPTI